jgi:hypothetical protein
MTSTNQLRGRIERRQAAHLWGQKRFITPRLLDHVFGDGKKMIWLSGINTRPAYWVVRIDSSWCLDNCEHDDGKLKHPREWLEDVYQAIEEEFGTGEKDDGSLYANARFPQACDLGSGTSWGQYEPRRTQEGRK